MLMVGSVSRSKHADWTLHPTSNMLLLPFFTITHVDLNKKRDRAKKRCKGRNERAIQRKRGGHEMKDGRDATRLDVVVTRLSEFILDDIVGKWLNFSRKPEMKSFEE